MSSSRKGERFNAESTYLTHEQLLAQERETGVKAPRQHVGRGGANKNNFAKAKEIVAKIDSPKNTMYSHKTLPVEQGDCTKYVGFLSQLTTLADTADIRDVEDLRNHFHAYLNLCSQMDVKVGNVSAALSMGVSWSTIKSWASGAKGKSFQELASHVIAVCSSYREMLVADNKINVVWGIFSAKNYDGMTDRQDIVNISEKPLGEEQTSDEIANKYKDMPL